MHFLDNNPTNSSFLITVGARSSPLSQAQVQEVLHALQCYHPQIEFDVHYMTTAGDRDQKTSLRTLGATDFFTQDIDQQVLEGHCQIGIHSAKDLPVPLTNGLELICLTQGIDAADVLVMRPGMTLAQLPAHACIATSSIRREEAVRQLKADVFFSDLRGPIHQRLAYLEGGQVEGVVLAEAALIRLGLTHLNRIRLPGPTAEGQGQLAIVARQGDQAMQMLFTCLESRSSNFL